MCGVGFLLVTSHIEGGYFAPADFGWVVGLGRVNDDCISTLQNVLVRPENYTFCASLFWGLADKM